MRTSPSAEIIDRKAKRFVELLEVSRELAMAGLRARFPLATSDELQALWHQRLQRSREEKWRPHD